MMHKSQGIAISILFWIVVTMPGLLLIGGYQIHSFENRKLASMPRTAISHTLDEKMYGAISTWLDDHIPLRNIALEVRSAFIQHRIISSNRVIVGDHGWLYLRDSILHTHASVDDQKTLVDQLAKVGKLLKSYNKELYIIIAPDKASIYPEHLPRLFGGINQPLIQENSSLRSMLGARKDFHYIDLWPSLLQNKKKSPVILYYKTDTHWTCKGGLPLVENLLNALSPGIYRQQDIMVQKTFALLDLDRMIGNQGTSEFRTCKTIKQISASLHINRSTTEMEGLWSIRNRAPINGKTMILYDSFLESFHQVLPAYFTSLRAFHSNEASNYNALSKEMASSQYIILELVERSFINWNRFVLANKNFYPLLEKELALTNSK